MSRWVYPKACLDSSLCRVKESHIHCICGEVMKNGRCPWCAAEEAGLLHISLEDPEGLISIAERILRPLKGTVSIPAC
jgi:DNA-binding helix-hairpin-helix protein with protein kinase domain